MGKRRVLLVAAVTIAGCQAGGFDLGGLFQEPPPPLEPKRLVLTRKRPSARKDAGKAEKLKLEFGPRESRFIGAAGAPYPLTLPARVWQRVRKAVRDRPWRGVEQAPGDASAEPARFRYRIEVTGNKGGNVSFAWRRPSPRSLPAAFDTLESAFAEARRLVFGPSERMDLLGKAPDDSGAMTLAELMARLHVGPPKPPEPGKPEGS